MDCSVLTGEDIADFWSNHDETMPPEPLTGIQGQSGIGSDEGRGDAGSRQPSVLKLASPVGIPLLGCVVSASERAKVVKSVNSWSQIGFQ